MDNQKKYRILLVDDNKNFLKAIKFQLEDIVNVSIERIDEAYDGFQAIAMIEKADYDLIFMDIDMPVLDGIEATKKIKLKYPHLIIIALSLYNSPHYMQAMFNAGADEYLLKDDLHEAGLMKFFTE